MAEIKANFGDREMMDDALDSEKAMTGLYNTCANECAGAALKAQVMSLLCETHQMQTEVYDEMSRRGWYTTEQAPQEKVEKAKGKFQNENS